MQKRSLKIAGHATSVALEPEFWHALKEIAVVQEISLFASIDQQRLAAESCNLASQLRVFVLRYYQNISLRQKWS